MGARKVTPIHEWEVWMGYRSEKGAHSRAHEMVRATTEEAARILALKGRKHLIVLSVRKIEPRRKGK